jgi:hypothetical protein
VPDDPKTKAGRAKMLRRAQQARRDVNNSDPKEHAYEVKVWSDCIDNIKNLQRRAGD